jgi:very-short-patch-repair endonuclease
MGYGMKDLESRVRDFAKATHESWFEFLWYQNAHATELTPIERLFRLALKIREHVDFCTAVDPAPQWFEEMRTLSDPDFSYVVTQAPIPGTKYRADFLFTSISGGMRKVVVECDGHDFHERTKEQAERDRKRERRLVELGYTVIRFTGREIWRDPLKCADEAINIHYGTTPMTLEEALAK